MPTAIRKFTARKENLRQNFISRDTCMSASVAFVSYTSRIHISVKQAPTAANVIKVSLAFRHLGIDACPKHVRSDAFLTESA
eukprot:4797383-Pleurochrysis_carterae.AAC.1